MKIVSLPESAMLLRQTHGLQDDFAADFVSGDRWTVVASDAGTVTLNDAAGGTVTLEPSDATVADNDETYLKSTSETFKIASGKPLHFEARVQYAEANTDDANIVVGFRDGVAADGLQDDGAGPSASFSGAAFYKVDGGTKWNVIYSDGGVQTKAELSASNSLDSQDHTAGGSSFVLMEIDVNPVSASRCDVTFSLDGAVVYQMKDRTFANATEMQIWLGVKNGGASEEKLTVDYVACYQAR